MGSDRMPLRPRHSLCSTGMAINCSAAAREPIVGRRPSRVAVELALVHGYALIESSGD